MALLAGITGTILSIIYLRRCNQGIRAYILPFIVVISAVIGARVLNYFTNMQAYKNGYSIWTPEYNKLSLMGGLIAAVAVIILYCIICSERFSKIADAFIVPCAAGIVLLKIGCFLNGCCFGKPTEGPFGMIFKANASKYSFINSLNIVKAKSPVVHPTQLYEIFGVLVAVSAAVVLSKKLKLREGSKAAIFTIIFAAARWIVLPFRELPYERIMTEIFYPCLYALIIVCSGIYSIYVNKSQMKDKI